MQLQGKAAQRVRDLGVETIMVASNYEEMESMVDTHGYDDGPWCDVFLFDVGAFYLGGLARHTSHTAWIHVFKATAESQTAAVKYTHKFFRDEGRRPEVKVFESMV